MMRTGTAAPMIRRTALESITRNNSAICLIDHQVGLLIGVHDITVAELKHNVVGLAKAAKIHGMPNISMTRRHAVGSIHGATAHRDDRALVGPATSAWAWATESGSYP